MIKVLFFARLKDQLGVESLSLENNFADVKELQQYLINEKGMDLLADKTLRAAVNQKFCEFSQTLTAGDEVAFMPPVTGG